MKRRHFLKQAATGTAGIVAASLFPVDLAGANHVWPIVVRDLSKREVEIFVGLRLVSQVHPDNGDTASLLNMVGGLRNTLDELGIFLPRVRISDDRKLPANGYTFHVYGTEVYSGELLPEFNEAPPKSDQGYDEQLAVIRHELAMVTKQYQSTWFPPKPFISERHSSGYVVTN